jgi:hypothetical protein
MNSRASSVMSFCWFPWAESLQRKVTWPSRISTSRPLEMATRCVASQILEDMLGTAEGRPGIDHPVQSLELSPESIEGLWPLPSSELAAKSELVSAVGNRQEFLGRGCQPFLPSPGLAVGASAMAAGLEHQILVGTVITLLEACSQSGGSACWGCPGTPCAGGTREYRPTAPGTPVGVDERPRRLPAEVPSPRSAVLLRAVDGPQRERIEGTANGLQSLQGHA